MLGKCRMARSQSCVSSNSTEEEKTERTHLSETGVDALLVEAESVPPPPVVGVTAPGPPGPPPPFLDLVPDLSDFLVSLRLLT